MMTEYFESPFRILQLRGGQYGQLLDVFAQELRQTGFAVITARRHIRAAEHLLYSEVPPPGADVTHTLQAA